MKKIIAILICSVMLVITACSVRSEMELVSEQKQTVEKWTEYTDSEESTSFAELVNSENTVGNVLVPPGTLPEVWQIPQPNQKRVGTVETFCLLNSGETYFVFMFDSKSKAERLLLFEGEISLYNGLGLVVLETSFGGWNELSNCMFDDFQALILANINISCDESQYVYNTTYKTDGCYDNEVLKMDQYREESEGVSFVIGRINPDKSVVLLTNANETESKALLRKSNVYRRIIERFKLGQFCLDL